eukprot:m.13513 g.13513  ORF g.13513 m.13513 type:complete len:163 (-) comp6886_c0_seq1:82-570(-)
MASRKHGRPVASFTLQEKMDLREVFSLCSADKSDRLDWQELRMCLRGLGFGVRKSDVKRFIHELNRHGDGMMDFPHFLELIEVLSSDTFSKERDILDGYSLFDKQNNGHITMDDLRALCTEVNEYVPDNSLRRMIEIADADGDGVVNKADFLKVMKRTNLFR